MNSLFQRQLVGFFGFALAAVWLGLGTLATLLCLLAGAASYLLFARLQTRQRDGRADEFFRDRDHRRTDTGQARRRRVVGASST